MRLVAAAFAGLATLSLPAASFPTSPVPASLGSAPVAELVPNAAARASAAVYGGISRANGIGVFVSQAGVDYSTVTDFARLRGLSMSQPFFSAT
jgi:hypothetical protein